MVEKELTTTALDAGEIRLSAAEAERLGLPPHAADLECLADGELVLVRWRPGPRLLGGEQLRDHLQLYGSAGGILRLQRTAGRIELRCLASRWSLPRASIPSSSPPTQPRPSEKREKARPQGRRRYVLPDRREYDWRGKVGIHRPTIEDFVVAIGKGGWDPAALFELRLRGEKLAVATGFDELLAVDLAHVDHMPHQEATALKVLRQMHGRAVLADEVGLGKTIEAGLIMKELIVRGIVRKVLVLCPAALREQWRDELDTKFDEAFKIATRYNEITGERVIMSIQFARQNQERVHAQRWDMVIVDEAHKEINGPVTRRLLANLEARYMLFLTATPVQNRLTELYGLIELLRPGTFVSRREFERRFVDQNDPRRPVNTSELRRVVSDVMVRTTREQVGLDRVRREAVDVPIRLSKTERQIYKLCTQGLRRVMTAPGDHLRRRHLAHRLTTSPRSLAATARKLADSHSDSKVRAFLSELSELAIDVQRTSRQQQLLTILREWTSDADKGKVVVFTQHADTLDDLARILGEEGIEASIYHGGLSVSARQRSIEQFRRSAAVLLSTDAGAEGLNLQFANCVVNYDLPWNPMKIEQRIGRVHRLTQPKDTVYIANLFATDTIDEHVYRLLHDKLKMFELLFGQVTTILGEIDSRDGAETFEAEILKAYLAPSDAEMERRIADFGRRLEGAYDRTQQAVRNEAGISSWLIDHSYREELRRQRADELRPVVEARRRERQEEVRRFARDFFRACGAEISEVEEDLISVELPSALAEAFGGREELHLAFSPAALELHRDAELCAAGSEVFEEMLAALRERGDLHASMPVVQDVPQEPWLPHAPNLRLLTREVLGPDGWSARAVWRTRCDGVDAGEDLRVVTIGDPEPCTTEHHRDLADGEELPVSLLPEKDVLQAVVTGSLPELREVREFAQRELNERVEAERARILEGTGDRLRELEREVRAGGLQERERAQVELDRLRRLRKHYRELRPGTVEVRAELVALELVGSTSLRVRERWVDDQDREFVLTAVWVPGAGPESVEYRDEKGRRIDHLVVCSDGHPADDERVRRCPGCQRDLCDQCDAADFRQCSACGVEQCSHCVSGLKRICRACASARRTPEHDQQGQRAWSLGFGAAVLIGETTARIVRGDGTEAVVQVGSGRPELRRRTATLAAAFGGRLDLGALCVKLPKLNFERHVLVVGRREDVVWEVRPGAGSEIDTDIGPLLREIVGEPMHLDVATPVLESFLGSLRRRERPDPAPRLVAREFRHVRYLESRGDQVWWIERWEEAGREPRVDEHPLVFGLADTGNEGRAVAELPGVRVELRRVHRSVVVEVRTAEGQQETAFVPGVPDATLQSESAALWVIRERGLPPNTVLFVAPTPPNKLLTFAAPSTARLVERRVEEEWIVERGELGEPFSAHHGRRFQPELSEQRAVYLERGLWSGLLAPLLGAELVPFALVPCTKVTETWEGESSTTRTYLVRPGEPAYPVLDDTGQPGADFGVDRAGHLAAHPVACAYCETLTCRACVDGAQPCALCDVLVCGRCAPQGTSHLCRACASLKRMRWLRRVLARGVHGRAVAGSDELHRVVFVTGDDGTRLLEVRKGEPNERVLSLSPGQAELLNAAARRPWFSADEGR